MNLSTPPAPSTMRVLLYGASGWIGGQMRRLMEARGWDVYPARARLEVHAEVSAELERVRPNRIVLAAGITGRPNIDWCETHVEETEAVNIDGTLHLLRAAARASIHITNFATGCIYEYDAAHPIGGPGFTELDMPNFSGSVYSRGKAYVEAQSRGFANQLLLRVRMPFTGDGNPRCFLTKIANYARVVDVPNSISVLPTLLPIAVQMIAGGHTGVYNFVNPGPVSHVQLLRAYATHVDASFVPVCMSQAEHDALVCARRSNCCLDATKLCRAATDLGMTAIPSAMDAVIAIFQTAPVVVRERVPRSLLITGGAGFIGSAVVMYCAARWPAARVTVVDVLTDAACAAHVPPGIELVRADVCDACALTDVLARVQPDGVLHLAAQTHVDASFANSLEFTRTNMLGTHTLLEAIRNMDAVHRPWLLHVSTDEVYGESAPGGEPKTETSLLLPTNPYAASKVGAEAMVHAYAKSFGLHTLIVRMNNVYGPRQFPEKVIPRFLCRAAAGEALQIQGSGEQTRHFLFVSDAASAILTVATRGVNNHVYNVGSADEIRMVDLASDIARREQPPVPVVHVADRAFNDCRYYLGDAKLRALGWAPMTTWQDGLALTRAWYATCDIYKTWPTASRALHALDEK